MESNHRLAEICEQYGVDPFTVRDAIKRTFPKKTLFFKSTSCKPQAFILAKALRVLQTYLATQDIDKMIDWAYEE